ncbi:MAG: dTDP-4-dehydrorhamnose 3,5-epimerase [Saprospiraceae bacterium]|jgi:dTDP-4-dehydrorhamnose 3,5-epimerase|nr:dTDP-4-dehydrorhamnose 3,5-epimerase [Saprospiraceae bacterium]
MKLIETGIQDLFVIEPDVFSDERGYFFESFSLTKFLKHHLNYNFVQDNEAKSVFGVIRGLHYQTNEKAQSKLVRVIQGSVKDVVVDIRPHSNTYGKIFSIELTETNKLQLLIPKGFAHGYSVLSDTSIFSYKCDEFYSKENEGGIYLLDPQLNIDWEVPIDKAIMSEKDKLWPHFGLHKM